MKRTFLSFVLMAGALAAQAVKAHAESMRFLQQAGANVIAQGDIDESTVAAFNAYKNAHPGVRRVVFDSMGGSVLEALALGRAIRQARLDTYVGGTYKAPGDGFTAANLESMGECYSACVYAFAGGMHRFFDATGGVMGIHQFEFVGNRTGDQTANEGTAQFLMTAIGVYLDEMVVWQLAEFREKRAVADLRRVAGFNPAKNTGPPLNRTRERLVKLAKDALAKLEG